ncbi:MAG: hypothetical protein L0Y54_11025 [Sporichthyaceae bacterium]|nr:hypothetical protein [Sporichthyaceae bacterium]
MTTTSSGERAGGSGHPVRGAIFGLLFFLFLGLTLLLFGVLALDSVLLLVLPLVGLVLGILWGRWAPLGGSAAAAPAPAGSGAGARATDVDSGAGQSSPE